MQRPEGVKFFHFWICQPSGSYSQWLQNLSSLSNGWPFCLHPPMVGRCGCFLLHGHGSKSCEDSQEYVFVFICYAWVLSKITVWSLQTQGCGEMFRALERGCGSSMSSMHVIADNMLLYLLGPHKLLPRLRVISPLFSELSLLTFLLHRALQSEDNEKRCGELMQAFMGSAEGMWIMPSLITEYSSYTWQRMLICATNNVFCLKANRLYPSMALSKPWSNARAKYQL